MTVEQRLAEVNGRINAAEKSAQLPAGTVTLVAVSKTFEVEDILSVIATGQRVFGENRVQESERKWPTLKQQTPEIELHLIGPLQSNKAAEAVALFDVIETVDREKIAAALAQEMRKQGRNIRLYVQVNIGLEPQKAGIAPKETPSFLRYCREELELQIEGLMCIPPADDHPGPYFALLRKLAEENGIEKLSMGMSGDFETAIQFGASSVRVGSAIFGTR